MKFKSHWFLAALMTPSRLAASVGSWVAAQEPEAKGEESPQAAESPTQPAEPPTTIEKVGESLVTLTEQTKNMTVAIDTVWVLVTGMLVFFMNLGFATVESGFCRAKNCVNILSKNFIVFAVTSIGFWLLGFGLMFGGGSDYVGRQG